MLCIHVHTLQIFISDDSTVWKFGQQYSINVQGIYFCCRSRGLISTGDGAPYLFIITNTRMAHSRVHISTQTNDVTKLLLLNKHTQILPWAVWWHAHLMAELG